MAVVFFCLVWLPCLLWFRPCAPSLEVVTFSLAPSWGPLGGQVFVGFPLGLAWVVCFGVPPFLTPGCLWFAVGLFVPGGGRAPRASRRHGVVSCGRCLLLARALLAAGAAAFAAPTSLRCLFGGSSDQSPHTCASRAKVFFAILLSKMPRLIRPSRCCCWVDVFTILVARKGISKDKSGHFTWWSHEASISSKMLHVCCPTTFVLIQTLPTFKTLQTFQDIAIMKQMQKHRAQVESLRSVFNDIDCVQVAVVCHQSFAFGGCVKHVWQTTEHLWHQAVS